MPSSSGPALGWEGWFPFGGLPCSWIIKGIMFMLTTLIILNVLYPQVQSKRLALFWHSLNWSNRSPLLQHTGTRMQTGKDANDNTISAVYSADRLRNLIFKSTLAHQTIDKYRQGLCSPSCYPKESLRVRLKQQQIWYNSSVNVFFFGGGGYLAPKSWAETLAK